MMATTPCQLSESLRRYIWRWPVKNGAEDLKKARWYLERMIARADARENHAESNIT